MQGVPNHYVVTLMPRPRKQLGQHWLRSEKALRRIVDAAQLQPSDRLLEIGPGMGVLTQRLYPSVESLVAVELDSALYQSLQQKFKSCPNILLLEGDILSIDLPQALADYPQWQSLNKVVANIPYYITGPILQKLLGTIAEPTTPPFEQIVLLIQKEVAERLCARPGSKIFGALSVRSQYLAKCEFIATVPAKAFYPAPKVDSAIVRLTPRLFSPPASHPKQFEQLVKLGFGAKRKMLRNNLKSVVDSDRLTVLLESLQIDPQARAESLSIEQWVALSNALDSYR